MKNILLIASLMSLLCSCTSMQSMFDDTYPIYKYDKKIETVKTPNGFVVSPQEIYKLTPSFSKQCHPIYADKDNYYILQTTSLIHANSYLAKQNGTCISGKSREDFESRLAIKEKRDTLTK